MGHEAATSAVVFLGSDDVAHQREDGGAGSNHRALVHRAVVFSPDHLALLPDSSAL